jgi:hypothetical protein
MDSEVVLEFSEQLLIGLRQLMIAQAQQSAWKKAVMSKNFILFLFSTLVTLLSGGLKDKLVSKLAMKVSPIFLRLEMNVKWLMQVSSLYGESILAMKAASSDCFLIVGDLKT